MNTSLLGTNCTGGRRPDMIEVIYRREVPYSRAVVLSQYFDPEHFEFVHREKWLKCLTKSLLPLNRLRMW